jgi:hypothetical protein
MQFGGLFCAATSASSNHLLMNWCLIALIYASTTTIMTVTRISCTGEESRWGRYIQPGAGLPRLSPKPYHSARQQRHEPGYRQQYQQDIKPDEPHEDIHH